MIRALIVIAGLAVGIVLGLGILLLNPLTLMQGRPTGLAGAIHTFSWQGSGAAHGFALTPTGLLGLANEAPTAFRERALRLARAEVVSIPGESGSAHGLGVRLSAMAPTNSLLQARLGIVTAWSIAWPGTGSVMLAGSENFWAPVRDGLWSALRGRGFQPGRARYPLPPMPGLGVPMLIAGSGAYAGVNGAFREELSPMSDAPGDLVGLRQLHLAIE